MHLDSILFIVGSKYGPFVRKWGAHGEVADLGQAFIAINPKVFADGFENRMSDLMSHLRNMEPVSSILFLHYISFQMQDLISKKIKVYPRWNNMVKYISLSFFSIFDKPEKISAKFRTFLYN